MRTLATTVGLALLATACGGSSGGTSGTSVGASTGAASTSGGVSSTGRGTSGTGTGTAGTATGGSSSGGTTAGSLAAGQPCTADSTCVSGICGVAGSGKCCAGPSPCATGDAACGASACDDTGACVYPTGTTACGETACANGVLTGASCNGAGSCADGGSVACAGHFACDDGGVSCLASCGTSSDCDTPFHCSAGSCVAPIAVGPCTEGDDCNSGVCAGAVDGGSGNCCQAACQPAQDPACTSNTCDATTGACVYPLGATCGSGPVCGNATLVTSTCDSHGDCIPTPTSCPDDFGCDLTDTGCNVSCALDADCASGAYCDADAGSCLLKLAAGPCSENGACTSGICGLSGTGHCCAATCTNTAAPCGAVDCDGTTALCSYPDSGTACGTVLESCTGSTQQNASACDGTGNCNSSPGTTDCTPFICGQSACLTTCTDNTSCGSSDFCDVANTTCCSGLPGDGTGTLAVDSKNGSDATACCGIGTNGACQTINQAMKLIDSAKAENVTLTATVGGAGGDWAPANEVYPIVLGWGVELSAPGVSFNDLNGNAELIDIAQYSTNDTGGGASILGTAASQVVVGMDTQQDQETDTSSIQVETGETLYIANAIVNGNAASGTAAITVTAGGSLLLGQDQSAAVQGTVDIGSPFLPDGWDGILCQTNATTSQGCTITDAALQGQSSVVITQQEDQDLEILDFGTVTLTSDPIVGVAPAQPGFLECPSKNDMSSSQTAAVLLKGSASLTFENGAVQCISGGGFGLVASASGGLPALTLSNTTIQNTELGLYASAGTATVSSSTIQYNYDGVEQDGDGTNIASVDLSGGTSGTTNTVVCSNSAESALGGLDGPGVDVLNNTSNGLAADNVDWDTAGPDVFTCGAGNANCTCAITTCTNLAGIDDMNAVDESSGFITTTGNGLSQASCTPPGIFCSAQIPCRAWETCCLPAGGRKSQCQEGPVCN